MSCYDKIKKLTLDYEGVVKEYCPEQVFSGITDETCPRMGCKECWKLKEYTGGEVLIDLL